MRTELTLRLERDKETGAPQRRIVDELVALGGWMTRWEPESLGQFGHATFVFADKADRDHFMKAALRVPGVDRHPAGPRPLPSSPAPEAGVPEIPRYS